MITADFPVLSFFPCRCLFVQDFIYHVGYRHVYLVPEVDVPYAIAGKIALRYHCHLVQRAFDCVAASYQKAQAAVPAVAGVACHKQVSR